MPNEKSTAKSTSRREFLRNSCSALAILSLTSGSVIIAGCDSGGNSSEEDTLPEGVTRDGNTLIVDLEAVPDLQEPNTSLWIPAADVIVIHGADVGYRAFRSVCPHEGEDVEIFEPAGSNGHQLRCPAHDWTFDVDGDPTGRAQAGLVRYSVTTEGATLQVSLTQ